MDMEAGGWELCPACHPLPPRRPGPLRRLWRWAQARYRLDLDAVCELSAGKGPADYHDYLDDAGGRPAHFTTLRCARCGKSFTV